MNEENILGISTTCESGAALFQNGKITFAVNEERFTRIKLDGSYPDNAINWCLSEAKLSPKDISAICFGFSNGMKKGKFKEDLTARLKNYSKSKEALNIINQRLTTEAKIDSNCKKRFEKHVTKTFPNTPIYFCHHHDAHLACALMNSPYKDALILTCDGRGDFTSITLSEARDGVLTKYLYHNYSWESLGYFYGRITHLCGFKAQRHEGKITGLAAKGNPKIAMKLMKKMIDFDGTNIISFPGDYYRPFFTNYSNRLVKEAAKYSREDLAAAAQEHLEVMVTKLIKKYARQTGLKNICVAGGLFANVKLNQRIREMPEINDIFVYPHMGDGGLCAGSVYNYFMYEKKNKNYPLKTLYLGPKIDNLELKLCLKKWGFEVDRHEKINETAIKILSSNKTIGLIHGRTEFGPRALGNRSILAACNDKNLVNSMNNRLDRNEFMPFAPAIASDFAKICLKNYKNQFSARHMTITYDVTEEFRKNSPSVVHDDGTVRPQIVFKEDNLFFYSLLMDWYKANGGLSLINTSFNLHENPVVSRLDDVMDNFMKNTVDYLMFPPYICRYYKNIG